MTDDDQLPADTRTMRIVHNALRRDLTRAAQVLQTRPYPGDDQRVALADHLAWMMHFLHDHHSAEDAGLYPLVRSKNPAAIPLLDEMDRDHDSIAPGMAGLVDAAAAYGEHDSGREQVVRAIELLEQTLLPHLQREEEEMMPVVAASISKADWDRCEHDFNIKPKSKRQLADEGLWIMEGQAPQDRRLIEELVPPIPRWIILNVFGRGYDRKTARRWGATAQHPAAGVTAP